MTIPVSQRAAHGHPEPPFQIQRFYIYAIIEIHLYFTSVFQFTHLVMLQLKTGDKAYYSPGKVVDIDSHKE